MREKVSEGVMKVKKRIDFTYPNEEVPWKTCDLQLYDEVSIVCLNCVRFHTKVLNTSFFIVTRTVRSENTVSQKITENITNIFTLFEIHKILCKYVFQILFIPNNDL